MKYRSSAWIYKVLAFVLAMVCGFMGFLSGIVTLWSVAQGYYDPDTVFQTTWQCREAVDGHMWSIIEKFRQDPDYDKWNRLMEDTNLRFIILEEETGDVVASYLQGLDISTPKNLKDNVYLDEYNYFMALGEKGSIFESVYVADYYFSSDWADASSVHYDVTYGVAYDVGDVAPIEAPAVLVPADEPVVQDTYQILLLLPQTMSKHGAGDSIHESHRIYRTFQMYKNGAPVVFAACALGFLACMVFLCFQAARRPGLETPKGTWFERLPLELLLAVGVFAFIGACGCVVGFSDSAHGVHRTVRELELICFLLAAGASACLTALLGVVVSFAARVKLGQWWNGLLCWRILAWCGRTMKRGFQWFIQIIVQGVRSIGMVPRGFLLVLVVGLLELLGLVWLVNAYEKFFPGIYLVILNLFLVLAFLWALAQMQILQKAAKALADGDLEYHLETARMYWDFKTHGDHLNAIAGGLGKAVDKQMRSERLKTELITNVSHDIKTPLTSIVNYVDLLQKPHTEAEGIQYLEVLDRQSKRLKRLTENLVEASKASTGNMAVHLEPTSVMELVNQSVEEYRDRMEAGKLETVVSLRGDLHVMADGKLMWRIMDNLLNNVIKYALPGTRVYVTAQKWGERAVIAVKNISRDPLNVDADELMERFVRGDSSRHTEGSGLGLNIARSLTQLQNGQFNLTVDGDFFKAEVSLPVA